MILVMINTTLAYKQSCHPLGNFLGNDTLICPDRVIYPNAETAVSHLWSDGSTEYNLLATLPREYSINFYPPTDICRAGIYYLRTEIEGASMLTKKLIQK